MRRAAFVTPLPNFGFLKCRAEVLGTRAAIRCCATSTPIAVQGARVISWNVNSLRSLLRKDANALQALVDEYDPDVLCLQETKLQSKHEELFEEALPGYTANFSSSQARLGYSGTAIYSKKEPTFIATDIAHETGDREGRVLMARFPSLTLVNVYTMNAGTGLKRLKDRMSWDVAFRKFLQTMKKGGRPMLVVGDLNVARGEADVFDERAVDGLAGFSDQERVGFEDLLETCSMVDAFRMLYPEHRDQFTYWDYRSKARDDNRGWRIDYTLVSGDMVRAVRDVHILNGVLGSDHCPVVIDLAPGFL